MGVIMDIFEEGQEVAFAVTENGFVSALKKVTDGPVFRLKCMV
jgi:hypothetical protein